MSEIKTSHEVLPGEIVFELNDPRNCDLYFHPISENVRSAVVPQRSGAGVPAAFTQIYTIPGQRIHVNVRTRVGRITDGLGTDENKRILEQVKAASNVADGKFAQPYTDPKPPRVYQNLAEDAVQTWLYWMARAADAGQGRFIQGESDLKPKAGLSLSETIRNTGKVLAPIASSEIGRREFGGKYLQPVATAEVVASKN